ncbi:hypothetical protein ACFFKC_11800 [Pseudoduganella danionis]|uniref:Uncharacterized protein n=1 Tax=Pseudoduganella danionis TaxID=1890295 RepID=A0ABW9SL08_9BURK|nr:hypothetical protein [Pseudoduganella danionis]MTW32301.1 hypothetical protein [Pseudoduganella danionis]
MKTIITTGVVIFAALSQLAFAQNTYQGRMNQDSTSLVPYDAVNLVRPVPNVYAAPTYVANQLYVGVCGASNNSILTSSPTSFLCNKGTPSAVSNSGGTYSWSCTGNDTTSPSNVASCSARQRVVGQCGSDNGQIAYSTPTNLCISGNPSAVSSNGTNYSWSCTGNYGTPASCTAPQGKDCSGEVQTSGCWTDHQ